MAIAEVEILNKLKAFADLTAFVGTRINGSDVVPPNTEYPTVNFFEVSGTSVSSFQGSSGLGYARFQFNCWSPSYTESKKIRDAVRRALTGKDVTFTGGVLQSGRVLNKVDMPRQANSKYYQATIDIGIYYAEEQS